MDEQQAAQKVQQFNDFALYGAPQADFAPIVRDLADAGYGVAWDASAQEYVLTDIPDLSVLE